MILVGLGQAGKNIVNLFKPHSKNYKIIVLDEGEGLESKNSVEDYDQEPIKLSTRGLKSYSEAILFVCGSGKVAGSSLRVLEALSGFKTTVVYIVPDLEFSSEIERKRHKVHFGVLQEYTRSGMIHEMLILDNKTLLDHVGSGTTLKYYEKINYFIYNTFQNIMYCKHVEPEFGKIHEKKEISKISTIGMAKLGQEEKMFFSLDNVAETCYYINIEEEDLQNDETIIPQCQEIVRLNKSKDRDTSYAIWKSSGDNHYYSMHYTHFIQ
jgi:hypothetical protein